MAPRSLLSTLTLALTVGAVHGTPSGTEVDLGDPSLAIDRIEPSEDGRWVAVECRRDVPLFERVWLVDVETGEARPVAGERTSCVPNAWGDGTLRVLATERSPARKTEVRWLDPRTGEAVRVTPNRNFEEQGLAVDATPWEQVERVRSGGKHVHRVRWTRENLSLELDPGQIAGFQVTSIEGVVFYAKDENVLRVYRHDLAAGRRREVCSVESGPRTWRVSPDGRAVATVDALRTRVLDVATGEILGGPYLPGEARWIESDGSRFLLVAAGGRMTIVDLVGDRTLDLGPDDGTAWEVRVLEDGRFLVSHERSLELFDVSGEKVRDLFPPRAKS